MNTFTSTNLTTTDERFGFLNRIQLALLPAACMATGGRVVTLGATRGRQGALSCGNIGQTRVEFVKRSFLVTPANAYFEGFITPVAALKSG